MCQNKTLSNVVPFIYIHTSRSINVFRFHANSWQIEYIIYEDIRNVSTEIQTFILKLFFLQTKEKNVMHTFHKKITSGYLAKKCIKGHVSHF